MRCILFLIILTGCCQSEYVEKCMKSEGYVDFMYINNRMMPYPATRCVKYKEVRNPEYDDSANKCE